MKKNRTGIKQIDASKEKSHVSGREPAQGSVAGNKLEE